ncbi:MAG: helix-turn-helix domain-containing protein [Deltaproteobacteria bacterium]|nr:helix-turn-helix domain-containing protein [Deltaproteobacteria bacterium]
MPKSIDKKEVGARLKQIRGDIPQNTFASIFGISAQLLSKYETGRVDPTFELLITAARHGRVTIEWILTGEVKEQKPKPFKVGPYIALIDKKQGKNKLFKKRMEFGKYLKAQREKRGLTVACVIKDIRNKIFDEDFLPITEEYLESLESGNYEFLDIFSLAALSRLFELDFVDLCRKAYFSTEKGYALDRLTGEAEARSIGKALELLITESTDAEFAEIVDSMREKFTQLGDSKLHFEQRREMFVDILYAAVQSLEESQKPSPISASQRFVSDLNLKHEELYDDKLIALLEKMIDLRRIEKAKNVNLVDAIIPLMEKIISLTTSLKFSKKDLEKSVESDEGPF